MEYELSQFKPEIKHIIDCINNLMPWDKKDLFALLWDKGYANDEIETWLQALGYVEYDKLDLVREIKDNDLESDVLDELSDWEIAYYVSCHPEILKEIDENDIYDVLFDNDNQETNLKRLENIFDRHPEVLEEYLEKHKFEKTIKYKLKKEKK